MMQYDLIFSPPFLVNHNKSLGKSSVNLSIPYKMSWLSRTKPQAISSTHPLHKHSFFPPYVKLTGLWAFIQLGHFVGVCI